MDGYFIINEDNTADERNVSVRFELHAVLHSAKSHLAGKPVYEDTPLAFIRVRDDETGSKIPHIVTDDIKRRFPKEWAKFEAENTIVEGSPLRMWPAITPAKLKEFTASGIVTVEQLADATDAQIGPEPKVWRERARQWLNPQAEIEALRAQVTALQNQSEKRGPGRPRRENV